MRLAAGVEYRGTAFSGWQSQRGARTVQDHVEAGLGRVANHPVRVVTAGRTDAGVHATGQVVHFDTTRARPPYSWMRGANSNLPADVRILWVREVPEDFHARFSAVERVYRYVMHASPVRPAIFNDLCAWVHYELDGRRMHDAAQCLLGTHDFSAFRAAGCQASTPNRTVFRLTLSQSGRWLWMDIAADAFLQHMVRNIVGSLILVGRGARDAAWLVRVLADRDRTRAGATAPPGGLYLSQVLYPAAYRIPAPMEPVRFW